MREDNADLRLTEIGRQIGLVDDNRYHQFQKKATAIQTELGRLQETLLKPTSATLADLASILETGELKQPTSLAETAETSGTSLRADNSDCTTL